MAEKLLVIRMSALGDVAMTIPVVYSFAKQYPDIQVSVLTQPFFAKLFVDRPDNLTLICFEPNKGVGKIRALCSLLVKLYKEKFSYVADLHNVLRSWIICYILLITGSKVKMVDKNRAERVRALQAKTRQKDFISRYCDVFSGLGFPVTIDFKSLFPNPPQLPQCMGLNYPSIGIAPTARYANKTYPFSLMKELVGHLVKEGFHVYLFGGKNDIDILNRISDGKAKIVAGKFDLLQELAIMYHLNLMLTMDSANQHLAALVGTKVLTIWGSTTPECGFSPFMSERKHAIVAACECQPCTIAGADTCKYGTLECMMAISPNIIINKIKQAIYEN